MATTINGIPSPVDPPSTSAIVTNGGALSPGSIILIVFFTLVIIYLVTGVAYNRIAHGMSGMSLLPHHEFWTDLPLLIRDGYMFFISPCLGNRVQYTLYERI